MKKVFIRLSKSKKALFNQNHTLEMVTNYTINNI